MKGERTRQLEEDEAERLVSHLAAQRLVLYQEVALGQSGGSKRADIVVDHRTKSGEGLEVIEVKTSLTLSLLAQARFWRHFASKVSIACPLGVKSRYYDTIEPVIHAFGFGVYATGVMSVGCDLPPEHRAADERRLRGSLHVDQQKSRAGNARGEFVTAYNRTVKNLIETVTGFGVPVLLKDAVAAIDHHYGSNKIARGSLQQLIRQGVIPALKIEKRGGLLYVSPAEKRELPAPDVF